MMVLGSFQCRGFLLLLHIVGQGAAVLAAGAGQVGYIFFLFFIYLPSFGRRLKYCGFGCNGSPRLVLVNRLEGLSLPRNNATIN